MKKKNTKRSAPSTRNTNAAVLEASNKKLIEEHIPYEADMLNGTYELLQTGVKDTVTRNAIIESYCIHCRALIDFMKNKGEVRASLFTDNFDSKEVCKGKNYNMLISDQIAHLSHRRTSNPEEKLGPKLWLDMYQDITLHLQDFISNIREPYTWTSKWERLGSPQLVSGSSNAVVHSITGPTGPTPI